MVVQEFAEPVALSSTQPTNVPLPRTAARLGFDLIALRARRKRKPMRWDMSAQGGAETKIRANCDRPRPMDTPPARGHHSRVSYGGGRLPHEGPAEVVGDPDGARRDRAADRADRLGRADLRRADLDARHGGDDALVPAPGRGPRGLA